MRLSMAGDVEWRLLHDAVFPADRSRQLLDMEMRVPRGIARRHISDDSTFRRDGEKSDQYYRRLVASHLVYLTNSMFVGGPNTIISVPTYNPMARYDSLELVNRQRQLRGLPVIGPYFQGHVPENVANSMQTFVVETLSGSKETFDIVFCRQTKAYVSPDLVIGPPMPESDVATANALQAKLLPNKESSGATMVALRPDFYDAEFETWMHRAIAFQESNYFASAKQKQADSVPSCNGTLNKCRECIDCLGNMIHESNPARQSNRYANVSHRQTPNDSARLLLLARSILMSCHKCNFHFGLIQRAHYFETAITDNSFPFDLSATTESQFPTDASQRCSDLFAKHMVRSALAATSITPPKVVKIMASSSSSGTSAVVAVESKKKSGLVQASSSSLLTEYSLWDHLVNNMMSDGTSTANDASQILAFHQRFWQETVVSDHAIEELRSEKHVSLSRIIPTGYLLREQYTRTIKNTESYNLAGSILFPPCHSTSASSFSRHLHDTQNSVNASQGKQQYQWVDYSSKRHLMGSALENPAHLWPVIIANAISVESYCLQWHNKPETINEVDPLIQQLYQSKYGEFSDRYGGDEVEFIKKELEPIYLEMYAITAKYDPRHGDPKYLAKLRAEDKVHGLLPEPYVEEEEKVMLKDRHELTRLMMLRTEAIYMRHIAKTMGTEVSLNLNSAFKSYSWQHVHTPKAALAAFNTFLAELVQSCYCNPAYLSLVSHFWPIPREYMSRPSDFLINGMWEWYHMRSGLKELVTDVLVCEEHLSYVHSGDDLEHVAPQFHVSLRSRAARYIQFNNAVTTLQQTEEGRAKFASPDWKMDAQWMSNFQSDYKQRFVGQVLDLRPMVMPRQANAETSFAAQ